MELPEGEIGFRLLQSSIQNERCIDFFAAYFRRPYQFSERVIFPGRRHADNVEEYIQIDENQNRSRFKIKVSQDFHLALSEFQIALGTPYLARGTYAMLKYSLVEMDIIQNVAPGIQKNHIYGPVKTASQLNMSQVSSKAYSVLKSRRN
ncbi:hypothetical protein PP175_21225 [Aneurinibacillus sp. Ricciae_BoGa-3]|uniref:hypothetical protein n=1 Tax=Aneurinibacillus sp. Ricciae_BoGa-3 TaxID=3022697 RepID=UPI0023415DCD|nr:hypothetical protein [Aneurinibacillus sp. Ricciae_BoGa-3]WCK53814.1 hypothetical protein PP175_21225 [Aneurinibacillus sp. Ricciae_BoGa-3]